MDEQRRFRRIAILMIFAMGLTSGWLGLHLGERASERAPDPYSTPVLIPH